MPVEVAEAADPAGHMTIDGRTYDLVRAFWCEPGPGVEAGTDLAVKVGAFHDDGRLIHLMATEVERDRDRPPVQQVSASEPGTDSHYQSGTVVLQGSTRPILGVENGRVRIRGDVQGGGEIVSLEAEFALPDDPGGVPGAC